VTLDLAGNLNVRSESRVNSREECLRGSYVKPVIDIRGATNGVAGYGNGKENLLTIHG
jgi:hypothetical protein